MQLNEIANKVQNIANAWENFKSINDRRLQEIERKGAADPLTSEQLARINHTINEQKDKISRLETAMSRPETGFDIMPTNDEHKSAFIKYLRKGTESELAKYEAKSLSASSAEDGGYLVAPTISKQIVASLEANSVMRKLASVETISSDSLDILSDQGDFEAGWVTEEEERKNTDHAKIKRSKIFVHEIFAQPKATQKLIDDASVDVGKWIVDKISSAFTKVESNSFIYGDGQNKPFGILQDKKQLNGGTIERINSQKEGEVTAESLIELYYSLDSEYAAKAKFLMHRHVIQQIRQLKCPISGQYLWSPGLSAGASDCILGAEIVESPDMPIPAKEAEVVIFADFSSAYKIVDRQDIRILRDPFTEKPFVKFYATKRVGGRIINDKAAKILKI